MEIKGLFSFTMNVFRFPFSFLARVSFNVFFCVMSPFLHYFQCNLINLNLILLSRILTRLDYLLQSAGQKNVLYVM